MVLCVMVSVLLGAAACGRGAKSGSSDGGVAVKPVSSGSGRGDALFLATAPAFVPDELETDFEAMGIRRLYVAGASLSSTGKITPLPPPPGHIKRPVVFVVMGDPGAESQLTGGQGELVGEAWGSGLKKVLADARSWADLAGVHIHLMPSPPQAEVLAKALKALRRIVGIPVSVTLPSSAPPEAWKPLAGAADEALVFAFGRRPETGDRLVPELPEAAARNFPVPFRLLLVLGGYGRAGNGQAFTGRRIPDGEIDRLSEDKALDFDFGQVLSGEPGNVYRFKPRIGWEGKKSLLSADGGYAQFQVQVLSDAVKLLAAAGRWAGAPLNGRVFLVDALPSDGHLLGFPALRALLTAKPADPKLEVKAHGGAAGRGFSEFSLNVANTAPAPSELTRFNNWILVRVEGGAIAGVKPGDFDRFELLSAADETGRPAPFGRAVACRLFENFWAPEEANVAGPIRVTGSKPRVFVSYKISLNDGRTVDGDEVEVPLRFAPAEPKGEPKAKRGNASRHRN